jgi:Na+/melibiose symporter-like transporter
MLKSPPADRAAGIIASLGEAPVAIARTVVAILFLYYLTDVLGMAPFAAGLLIMVGRIWEAALDALLTIFHRETVTPFWWRGVRAGGVALFTGLSFVVLWYPFLASGRSAASAATVLLLFLLYILALSLFSVPYKLYMKRSAHSEGTHAFIEKARFVVVFLCGLVASILPLVYIHTFADIRTGFVRVAVIIAVIITASILSFFIGTRAYIGSMPAAVPSRVASSRSGSRRLLRALLLLFSLCFAAIHMLEGFVIYYMKYWIGNTSNAAFLFAAVVIASLCTAPLWLYTAKRFGDKTALTAALTLWAASQLLWLIPGWQAPITVIVLIGFGVGIGYGGIHIVPVRIVAAVRNSMIPEGGASPSVDPDLFSGVGAKLGAAFAPPVIGAVLQVSGYAANAAPPGVVRLLMCAGPLVFILAALCATCFSGTGFSRRTQLKQS